MVFRKNKKVSITGVIDLQVEAEGERDRKGLYKNGHFKQKKQ